MTTNTYSGAVVGPITVSDGNEADFNGATVQSGAGSNAVQGTGAFTVKLTNSSLIIASNRGVTNDGAGVLTISLDRGSRISGYDGLGSTQGVIALNNAGLIGSNNHQGNGVYLGAAGSTIVNSGTIYGDQGQYAIYSDNAYTVTNSGTISTGQTAALRFGAGGGVLNLSDGTTAGVINGGIVDNGPLTLNTNRLAYTLNSVISGSGSLAVTGGNTLTLNAANTYSGGTTLTGTQVVASHASNGTIDALGLGPITLADNSLSLSVAGTLANAISSSGGGAQIFAAANVILSGHISGSATGSLFLNPSAGATLTLNHSGDTFTGDVAIGGVGVTFAAANVFNAGVALRGLSGSSVTLQADQTIGTLYGDLNVTGAPAAGAVALTLGALSVQNPASGQITGALSLTKVGSSTLTLTGTNTYTGGTTVSAGTLQIGGRVYNPQLMAFQAVGSITGDVVDNATLEFSRSDATTFGGVISGSGGVVVDSGGTLTLSGANTYSGGTTVTGGATVVVQSSLGSGGVVLNAGTLSGVANGGPLSNAVTLGAGGGGLSAIEIDGVVSGSGVLTLTNTVALGGDNTGHTGATVLAAGAALTPSASAELSANIAGRQPVAFLSPSSAYRLNMGASLVLGVSNQAVGSLADGATAGGVIWTDAAFERQVNLIRSFNNLPAFTGPVVLTTGGDGTSTTFSGVIRDDGAATLALTKVGAGVQTLTGASTYTGSTTVSGGVLAVDGSLASAVTVAGGGVLRGVGTDSAGVTVQSGGTFAPGDLTGVFSAASLSLNAGATFAETITGANGFGSARIAGAASLNGALTLAYTGGAESYGTVYTVLSAGAVSGAFTNSTVTSGGRTFAVGYTSTSVTLTDVTNTAPTIAGTHASSVGDRAVDALFSGVTVMDPDTGQTETATISFRAADGALTNATLTGVAGGVATYTVSAGSAAALTTALGQVGFTPTPQPAGAPATVTTVTLTVSDGLATTAPDTSTMVTATHTTNTPVTAANGSATQATDDKHTAPPFAAVTVTDPDSGQIETATITYAAANGVLSGAGLTGQAGSYGLSAASAQALQAALQALTFTPTANQVAPGSTVTTTFTVTVSDGSSQASVADTVTAASVNDAPSLAGLQAAATAPAAGAVTLQPTLGVADPDVNASALSAQVAITQGFTAGDRLSVTTGAGISGSYNAATGVLTLTGAASDAAYAAALRSVSFSHDGAVAAGQRTVTFTVTDDQGAASAPAGETITVGGYTPPSTTTPAQTPSQQANYTVQSENLIRAAPGDAALSTTSSPLCAQSQAAAAIAAKLDAGQLSAADAQSALFHLVDGTTSVAEISYAFFTGRTPTASGLNYLVHSSSNANDLNDSYYQSFTTENRYINFAANLATVGGAGAQAFQTNYGSLSLSDATAKAYQAVFGITASADKISAILGAQVSDGRGGLETRAQYLADITGGSSLAQKAAVVGFLLADSVKEGFGLYQQADQHFLQDLAHGTAAYNVDLLAAYTAAPTLVGQTTLDPTLGS